MAQHDPFTVDEVKKRRDDVLSRYEERKRGDVRRVLATAEGRRFIWRILCEGRIHHTCFDLNALQMAYHEGRRDIGLFIENEVLQAKPETLEQMRTEAVSDKLIREAELLKAEKGEEK